MQQKREIYSLKVDFETKFAEHKNEVENHLDDKLLAMGKSANNTEENKYQCPVCDFVASSKQGLKVHQTRKHTTYKDSKFPERCEICDERYVLLDTPYTTEEIEKHILSHAYRSSTYLKYKCDECDFWGPNPISMEVHVRKLHSEIISCGVCGFATKEVAALETHLNTCETFTCLECKTMKKNICDIKDHMKTDHKGKSAWIRHCQSDRKFSEYFDTKDYLTRELFSKKFNK